MLEILVVLLVLGILVSLASYKYKRYSLSAKRLEALQNLGEIRKLEEVYKAENGKYLVCDWSPEDVPPPSGTKSWNNSSYFYYLGFHPRGSLYYRYGVAKANGSMTTAQCMADVLECYNDSVIENAFVLPRDGVIDILMKAEGDLDGDGKVGKLFIPDEPPERVVYVNYAVY